MTLLSAVIPLAGTNTPDEQIFLGRHTHGFFMNLVGEADAALADRLHRSEENKPFTVSALIHAELAFLVQPEAREGDSYILRITSIDTELSQALQEEILPRLPDQIQLGPATFTAGQPATDESQHPWARTTTAMELVGHWFGPEVDIGPTFELEFASPTTVRQIKRNILLPWPAGVMGGYLRAWNAHCQPAFDRELVELVENEVLVSKYDLKTYIANYGDYQLPGWMGNCSYVIFHRETSVRRVINLLADFSQFCGTGYKTTQGMGQTRRINRDDRL